MNILTLEQIKAQCRIDPEMTEEDSLLELYGDAAEETVLNYCNRSLESLYEEYGRIPAAITQGALMLVANSYKNREPASSAHSLASPPELVKNMFVMPVRRARSSASLTHGSV